MKLIIILPCLLSVIAACGNHTQDDSPEQSHSPQKKSATLDESTWTVNSKTCGSAIVPTQSDEFVFKSGFLGWRTLSSRTDQQECIQIIGYNRLVSSFNSDDTTQTESSMLEASVVRTACEKVVNGIAVTPPVSDKTVNAPSGNPLEMTLSSSGNHMNASIKGSDECPQDLLKVSLTKE
jgi:hypothetical protein